MYLFFKRLEVEVIWIFHVKNAFRDTPMFPLELLVEKKNFCKSEKSFTDRLSNFFDNNY